MFVRRDIKCLLHFNWTLHPNFTPFSCAVYEWTSIKSCHVKDCMNGDMCVQVSRCKCMMYFISLALHESCDDLSFQDFVRLFASAVSFSKPKWICSLQINFLNLMACQCQWAFKGWFFNVCVLIWRWLLSVCRWWRWARAEEIRSEWKQKKTKANEMQVVE